MSEFAIKQPNGDEDDEALWREVLGDDDVPDEDNILADLSPKLPEPAPVVLSADAFNMPLRTRMPDVPALRGITLSEGDPIRVRDGTVTRTYRLTIPQGWLLLAEAHIIEGFIKRKRMPVRLEALPGYLFVYRLEVGKDERGKGYAQALLKAGAAFAQGNGLQGLVASTAGMKPAFARVWAALRHKGLSVLKKGGLIYMTARDLFSLTGGFDPTEARDEHGRWATGGTVREDAPDYAHEQRMAKLTPAQAHAVRGFMKKGWELFGVYDHEGNGRYQAIVKEPDKEAWPGGPTVYGRMKDVCFTGKPGPHNEARWRDTPRARSLSADWDESLHPRDHGKFAGKEGADGVAPAPVDGQRYFVRFGLPPTGGRSTDWTSGSSESGVSVYESVGRSGAYHIRVPEDGEWADEDLSRRIRHAQSDEPDPEEAAFVVTGTIAGKGHDGEPLLSGVKVVGRIEPEQLKKNEERWSLSAGWDEALHPRDHGRFAEKEGVRESAPAYAEVSAEPIYQEETPAGYRPPDTSGHPCLRGLREWGGSHSNSYAITSAAAAMMGIDGWRGNDARLGAWPQKCASTILGAIASDAAGSEEPLFHGFDAAKRTFSVGDSLRLPPQASAGSLMDAASYGTNGDNNSNPTVLEFAPGTQMGAYDKWKPSEAKEFGHVYSEAIVAGGFKVEGVRQIQMPYFRQVDGRWEHSRPVSVVRLRQTETFDPSDRSWKPREAPKHLAWDEALHPRDHGKFAEKEGVTSTPQFKAWFGDSKVVDADGQPLVVYKGMYPYDYRFEGKGKDSTRVNGPEITSIDRKSEFPSFNGDEPGVKIAGFFGDAKAANGFVFKAGRSIRATCPFRSRSKLTRRVSRPGRRSLGNPASRSGTPFEAGSMTA